MPVVDNDHGDSLSGKPITADAFVDLMIGFGPFSTEDSIAIAVSGGPDSMALCRLMYEWAKEHGVTTYALTVDHQLRDAARIEALSVKGWLERVGMPHEVLKWDAGASVKHLNASPQSAARDARFELMFDWCRRLGVKTLMTAHHADDQAETFLYRLIRGSGVDGLAAMSADTHRNGIRLLRPLLGVTKTDLISTCDRFNQAWVSDPSNNEDAFARVRIRKIMGALEEEGLHRDRLLKTVGHMQRAKAAIDHAVEDLMSLSSSSVAADTLDIHIGRLMDAPEEVTLRCLARCLMHVSGTIYPPRFESLIALYRALGTPDWTDRTLHGCQLRAKDTLLVVSIEQRKA